MKKNGSIVLAVLLLAGGIFLYGFLSKKKPERIIPEKEKTLLTIEATPLRFSEKPYQVYSTGRLKSSKKLTLRTEVGGTVVPGRKKFKLGVAYRKGELILNIDDRDIEYEIKALRSSVIGRLSGLLADLKTDFPESYSEWKNYFESLTVKEPFEDDPRVNDSKLLNFLSSRGFYTEFYQLRKLENTQRKHRIVAPFNCIISEGDIQPGTLVSPGSVLGTLIDPINFELELYFQQQIAEKIEIGSPVYLFNGDSTRFHKGKVLRKGSVIDPASNQIQVFAGVEGNNLKDGSYWNASIPIIPYSPISEISSVLVGEDSYIWKITDDNTLERFEVNRLYEHQNQTVISSDDSLIWIPRTIQESFRQGMEISANRLEK